MGQPQPKIDFTGSINHGLQVGTSRDVYYNVYQPEVKPKPKPTTTVPFGRDKHFIHRKELDAVLERSKEPFTRIALVGLGGMGKSQIAIEFSWIVREASPDTWIFWIYAGSSERIRDSLRKIADLLDIPGKDDATKDISKLVGPWLAREENGKWIVIVDNADEMKIVTELSNDCIPEVAHGFVLVTSRSKDAAFELVGDYQDIIELNAMDEEAALNLFRAKCSHQFDEVQVIALLEQLERVPCRLYRPKLRLAVTQAASFIMKGYPRMNVSKYMDALKSTDQDMTKRLLQAIPDRRRDNAAMNSVVSTLQISFEHIKDKEPSASSLLSMMSLCDRQGIPENFVEEGLKQADIKYDFENAIETLRDYSLVAVDSTGGLFEMHRLVQIATRAWLDVVELRTWKDIFISCLAIQFPDGTYDNWKICRLLYPHALLLMQYSAEQDQYRIWRAQTLYNVGYYTCLQGHFVLAETILREAVNDQEKAQGVNHHNYLEMANELAFAMERQRKYKAAESIYHTIADKKSELFGKGHPSTQQSSVNLALVLLNQGKFDKAEPLLREAIAAQVASTKMHGNVTLAAMSNLVTCLSSQGKYEEAEQLARQVISERRKTQSENHPELLTSLVTLANVLHRRGQIEEAERLYQSALASQEIELGKDHPDTLTTRRMFARMLNTLGRYSKAEPLLREVLISEQASLGEDDINRATVTYQLATALDRQQKYAEAEQIYHQALTLFQQASGEDHSNTLVCMQDLVLVLREQHKFTEAEPFQRQVVAGRQKLLGEDHANTIFSTECLASILTSLGKYDEAEKVERQVLAMKQRTLGEDDPATRNSAEWLAGISALKDRKNATGQGKEKTVEDELQDLQL